jgi:excisionase family DNA binding protein
MLSSAMRIELDLETRPTLSVDEAAVLLGISRSSAYAAVKAGQIPSLSFGRRLRVPTAALVRLLALDGPPAA